MKIYTIIVTYNGLKWIDNCIRSVDGHSDVIVVDNNSSDNTVSYVAENFPFVIVLAQTKNLGFGVANNVGISFAINKGADAIFLLNQDAYAGKDCIKKLVSISKSKPEYGIISPVHLNGDGSALDYSFQKVAYMSPLISDLITKHYSRAIYNFKFINAAAWFIPKEVFLKVGGFDPLFFMYGEDDNFSQRVLYHNFKIGVIPNSVIFHDSSNNNYQLGAPRSAKYYGQFLNSVHVKYANINTEYYKKLRKYKFYLLKKMFFKLVVFKIDRAIDYFKKYKLIKLTPILYSVNNNKKEKPKYLDLN